jgi:predicted MPP superfamily phosphohydrolase
MKNYVEWGADLVLSGHLHGGIVRIPGLVGAISPSFEIFPKYSGDLYYEEDTAIVVSKGLGTHTINIRLFNSAEVVVIHLKSDNSCM